jgi:exopolyphosphatase/guanosine-5'-triphosphate,3'-diphosphate pyrophosphatase
VGTGGTITTFRAVAAARADLPLEKTDTRIEVAQMHRQAAELSACPLAARRLVPGMPPARADVFPTALITLCALAEAGGITAFRHSFYNLRFGLAAEALDGP